MIRERVTYNLNAARRNLGAALEQPPLSPTHHLLLGQALLDTIRAVEEVVKEEA